METGAIVIYQTADGQTSIDVKLEQETIWLTQKQIAELFNTQRPAITKHLSNIFNSGELSTDSVSSILEHTTLDGKKYKTKFYNLDVILSVGYRVNSKNATQFRIWANRILKECLVKGYAINEKRLEEQRHRPLSVLVGFQLSAAMWAVCKCFIQAGITSLA
ncbi:virulence RhuM family protein [Niabella drilacis]|uniref:Virulence protein RhuM family protein n=1 Tax=Niabella drilacis (strain DSM 25811 / CCM 8410 / CCUG 62505 / LMG 26954 / E90) TaxID=1285928 RepID=A0A1G6JBP1_NIADE|nr:RhuM family protein [Niabella drilacis]SDC16302.1 Virulence protein RhuM family protein [Niabella drilacis]